MEIIIMPPGILHSLDPILNMGFPGYQSHYFSLRNSFIFNYNYISNLQEGSKEKKVKVLGD